MRESSLDEEDKRGRQIYRLNYFYAATVLALSLILIFVAFSIALEQRELIQNVETLTEERSEELEKSQERLIEIEDIVFEKLSEDRFRELEDNIVERVVRKLDEPSQDSF